MMSPLESPDQIRASEVAMLPTLVEQYQRWFEYEKDSHRKVLASLESVPADRRVSEPFQKALNLMGHIVAARRMWLHRFGVTAKRPANLFPYDVAQEGLLAELEGMERDWSDYLQRLSGPELGRVFEYRTT